MSFQLSYLFTNHMILQRDKRIAVFGTGKTGSKITVSLLDNNEDVVTSSAKVPMTVTGVITDSKFLLYLPPLSAGGPYTLRVTDGSETLEYYDVLLGDLWFAGGQSNMEFNLQSSDEYKAMLEEVREFWEQKDCGIPYHLIRHYFVPHISYVDDNTESARRASVWQLCTPGTIPYWSAVAFFFARRLAPELNVPIGIINCNWGGTSASAWLDNQTLMSDLDTAHYYERYEKATAGITMEQYLADLEAYKTEIQAWDEKKNACYAKDPDIDWNQVLEICGPCPWPGPMGPRSEFRPCGLYETMIQSCVPYTLKGFLWYQGESDEGYADSYPKLMRGVIEEKNSRIVEVIVSSLHPFQLMMGKIVGIAAVGLTQFLLWIIVLLGTIGIVNIAYPNMLATTTSADNSINLPLITQGLLAIDFSVILPIFLVFFILGYLLYASLFAAVGATTETDSQQVVLPITIPLILSIVLSPFIVASPSGAVAQWLSMIPFTSPVAMMIRLPFGVPLTQVWLSAAILLVSFVLLTWMAARIYRIGILMYGKKTTLKETWKWIRERKS